ncbi:helix-turn-helix transcriptional regulator [Stappia sp. F7233]|uniref:Helix-turn-helix transcriptional regulator n=1 Tax=Stappia albiluteola TaxID=2758565 RepID=A0A839AK58_9HYPH|nr:metalloregulator ArsR/SmtB family transcription factor [Stappia albiluteola]MBA5779384.1 helix-turn-helix transcriptional regulator [Stappia albiluteola]
MPRQTPPGVDDAACEHHCDLASLFKALGHPVRLEILRALAAGDDACCGKIVNSLPLAQSTVSQHLAVLKSAGLVRCEVVGRCCHYSIDRKAIAAFGASVAGFLDKLRPSPTSVSELLPVHDNSILKDVS